MFFLYIRICFIFDKLYFMSDEEIFQLLGYIMASSYRTNTVKCIGDGVKIPSDIADAIGIRTNHVSNVLNDLKSKDLVVCLNEDARKGRLYKNTDTCKEVLKYLD